MTTSRKPEIGRRDIVVVTLSRHSVSNVVRTLGQSLMILKSAWEWGVLEGAWEGEHEVELGDEGSRKSGLVGFGE